MVNVLLIEDEALFAKSVLRRLKHEGYEGVIAESITEGKDQLQTRLPDILLLDVRLPDGSGLDLLAEIRGREDKAWQSLAVVVMTAYGELDDAVLAMKMGATDYLKKPVDLDELVLTLSKVISSQQLNKKLDYSQIRDSHAIENTSMVGTSPAIKKVSQQLQRIATLVDKSVDNYPVVLITGETGTGKDVAARQYHQYGRWNQQPFVHIDCASLPSELIEAELFGYERGAFTNAHQAKAGLIEVAEGGTLFLDEVGELPLDLQAKLLNVLERRVVRRLGSTKEQSVKAHFVAATNRNLKEMVAEGTFRSDLLYRLNILELVLPPLREREEDILVLTQFFIQQIARRYGLAVPSLPEAALQSLQQYSWPGNVRELLHVLERTVMLCKDDQITIEDLMLSPHSGAVQDPELSSSNELEQMKLEEVEHYLIERALNRCGGNVSRAARELGLTRMAMRYRLKKYKL